MKKLSFIVPALNEAQTLEKLYSQIKNSVAELNGFRFEIIFIDDGSKDNSLEILKKIREKDYRVEIISFRKNLGKSIALKEGFRKASGNIIVTLDADLQDDPSNLKKLIDKLDEGHDLVVGWRQSRIDPLDKTLPSRVFNTFVKLFSRVDIHDFNSGFKVIKKEVVGNIKLYGELHRFIPVLAAKNGFRVGEVAVIHRSREFGVSKYGSMRIFKGFIDFITVLFLLNFGQKPLHLFGLLGFFSILLGVIFAIYLSLLHFQGYSIGTRPLLTFSVLLIISGLQIISTGLIAEMIVSRSRVEEKPSIEYESISKR